MFSWVEQMASYSREQEQKRDFEQWLFDSAAPVVPATSAEIQNIEQANALWRRDFVGINKPVTVNYKRQQVQIFVTFSSDHAFTGKNAAWAEGLSNEKRALELDRAQHMDDIWKVLQHPDVVTWSDSTPTNKQYDKVLEAEDSQYGRVVLVPKPTAADIKAETCTHFEFASFHLPSETQFKSAKNSRSQTLPTKVRTAKKK